MMRSSGLGLTDHGTNYLSFLITMRTSGWTGLSWTTQTTLKLRKWTRGCDTTHACLYYIRAHGISISSRMFTYTFRWARKLVIDHDKFTSHAHPSGRCKISSAKNIQKDVFQCCKYTCPASSCLRVEHRVAVTQLLHDVVDESAAPARVSFRPPLRTDIHGAPAQPT